MTVSDKELLLLAAKASGLQIVGEVDKMVVQPGETKAGGFVYRNEKGGDSLWNPLLDDGDCLRMAVYLEIDIRSERRIGIMAVATDGFALDGHIAFDGSDQLQVTRRLIVEAAAAIGKLYDI